MEQTGIQHAMERVRQYYRAGHLREAEAACREILKAKPDQPDALHALGLIAIQCEKLPLAVELFACAIAVQPHAPESHFNLGVALWRLDRVPEATESFRRTVALEPDHPDAWNNLGVLLQKQGRTEEAIAAMQQAVRLRPDAVKALSNLGNTLARARRYSEAIAMHKKAAGLQPETAEIQNDLGCALYEDQQYEEALEALERAIELRPNFPQARCTLAIALHRAGRLGEALVTARNAVQEWPESDIAKYNLAIMLLLRGQFREGLPLYEARFGVEGMGLPPTVRGKPRWSGSDLHGERIYLHTEQGFGDAIQFARYAPLVQRRGGRVILGVRPELVRLMRWIEGVDQIVINTDPPPFDLYCPLLSLPLIFNTDLPTIPAEVPYLRPDQVLVGEWSRRLSMDDKMLNVGLVWAGQPGQKNDRSRSVALSMLASLARVRNVRCFSLQKGPGVSQLSFPPPGMELMDVGAQVQDFADSAAVLWNLDLLISADTAPAHLAGALGKPVWVLLPHSPDWRWLLDRDDSPWYPTMRLFRQPRRGDWSTPISRVVEALKGLRE